MKKIFFCVTIFLVIKCSGQDPGFVHSYSSSLNMNPAFAGAYENPELNILYRRQWPAFYADYEFLQYAFNHYSNALRTGLGAYYMNEITHNELYKTKSFHLDISPAFLVGDSIVLKPAFEIAYFDKWVDWDLVPVSVLTSTVPKASAINFFDYSAGLLLYQKYFDVGFALHHITEPDESFTREPSKLPRKFTAHGSVNLPLDGQKKFFLSPNFRFWQQEDFRELNLNLAAKLNFVLLSAGWRESNSYIFAAGYAGKRFRLSFAYDKTISKLRNADAYSHEFFASWLILNEKIKSKKPSLKRVAL